MVYFECGIYCMATRRKTAIPDHMSHLWLRRETMRRLLTETRWAQRMITVLRTVKERISLFQSLRKLMGCVDAGSATST